MCFYVCVYGRKLECSFQCISWPSTPSLKQTAISKCFVEIVQAEKIDWKS